MIGKLKGKIENIEEGHAIVDVNGVGYLVHCSGRTLGSFTEGDAVSLNIETFVREDAISLYGFSTRSEQEAFVTLNTVQGVGAKVALAILSALEPQEIARAVAIEDASVFKKVSGVGPKLAARLITELKGKSLLSHEDFKTGKVTPIALHQSLSKTENDAVAALSTLGYSKGDSLRAVSAVLPKLGDNAKLQDIITASLKELAA